MLELIIIAAIIYLILLFFHNQALSEFKINQIGWSEKTKLENLLAERQPLVVKGLGSVAFWTMQDCMMRSCYETVPIFQDKGLSEWLASSDSHTACPWTLEHAKMLGELCGLRIWSEREMDGQVFGSVPGLTQAAALWYRSEVSCWSGSRSLWLAHSRWTCIFVTEGAIQVSIMPKKCAKALPVDWKNRVCHPGSLTVYDTPFVADLKFMDIILRPGHMLIMPNHWFISWLSLETSEICPMVCCIEYHNPMSLLARRF
jgi:hypothetical protein